MNIPKLSTNRPVTTIMVFFGIVLLGFISWTRLPQELFPSISYPQITVVTSYENAAPEEMENLVTKIIEEAVGTVSNVKNIKSTSKEGMSFVIIDFKWGTNMDFAALNVREKIDLIKERLPRDCEEPIVMKYNPFELPIMNLAITANTISSVELRKITNKHIKEEIEKISGVANAAITGGDIQEIIVEIDQARLRASQISIVTIINNLENANLNYPAGTIKESVYEYLIRTIGEFQNLEEIEQLPTALELEKDKEEQKTNYKKDDKKDEGQGKRLVYLEDIASVRRSVKEKNSMSRYNGKESISLVIRKQSAANTIKVADEVKEKIKYLLNKKLPPEVNIQITYDQSSFIKESITNLRNAAIQGAILAFFVLLFFLRDKLSALAIIFSIPVSLMATFCLMYFSKINLNMMSLGGLALGIGMLVDNSIVVIENIFRHRQMNKPLQEACYQGANEVALPISGATLTTVAVFLPFAFVVGIVGQIFKQLSFTIAFSLLVSIAVAVSLIPVLISLRKQQQNSSQAGFDSSKQTQKFFSKILSGLFKIKGITLIITFIIFLVGLQLLATHQKRFLPEVDQRQFMINLNLAPGTKLQNTDQKVKIIEDTLLNSKDIKDVTVNIGSDKEKTSGKTMELKTLNANQAQIMVNLKEYSKKKGITLSTKEVINKLKESLKDEPSLRNAEIEYIAQESSLGQVLEESMPVVIEIRGPQLDRLAELSARIKKELQEVQGLYSVKSSFTAPTPETKLNVLKDKASLYGLSVKDIAVTAQVALKGYVATKFRVRNEEQDIDIRVRLRQQDRANLENLRRLLIRSPLGTMIPLSQVATVVKGSGPTEIQRVNQQRTIIVTANILNRPLEDILQEINQIIENISRDIPDTMNTYSITVTGEKEKMKESFGSLAFALILAVVLVYMIMASEFESLWQPFVIMFTLPLSLIGVIVVLKITGTALSVVAYLGIIMLGGIVVNNGIVLIDFINGLRKEGYTAQDAAIKGASVRLRPILMTSLTTILGMLPLSLGIGKGAELRTPLARTVIGGLLSSSFLTLIIIPIVYVYANNFIDKFRKDKLPDDLKDLIVEPKHPYTEETLDVQQEEKPLPVIQPKTQIKPDKPVKNQKKENIKEDILSILSKQKDKVIEKFFDYKEMAIDKIEYLKSLLPGQKQEHKEPEPKKNQLPSKSNILYQELRRLREKQQDKPTVEEPKEDNNRALEKEKNRIEEEQQKEKIQQQEKQDKKEQKQTEERTEEHKEKEDILQQDYNLEPKEESIKEQQEEKPEPKPKMQQPEKIQPKIKEKLPRQEKAPQPQPEPQPQPQPKETKKVKLNARQEEILEKLKTIKKVTRKEYTEIFDVSTPTAARDLKKLSKLNLIQGKGPLGPGRWYELTDIDKTEDS